MQMDFGEKAYAVIKTECYSVITQETRSIDIKNSKKKDVKALLRFVTQDV